MSDISATWLSGFPVFEIGYVTMASILAYTVSQSVTAERLIRASQKLHTGIGLQVDKVVAQARHPQQRAVGRRIEDLREAYCVRTLKVVEDQTRHLALICSLAPIAGLGFTLLAATLGLLAAASGPNLTDPSHMPRVMAVGTGTSVIGMISLAIALIQASRLDATKRDLEHQAEVLDRTQIWVESLPVRDATS